MITIVNLILQARLDGIPQSEADVQTASLGQLHLDEVLEHYRLFLLLRRIQPRSPAQVGHNIANSLDDLCTHGLRLACTPTRKPADGLVGLVGLGEGRATFENEVIAERRPIEGLQSPDDPCVLFQKMDWPPGLLCSDRKNISEILSRELQKLFSHGRPFLRCGQASRETGGGTATGSLNASAESLPLMLRSAFSAFSGPSHVSARTARPAGLFPRASCQRGTCFSSTVWLPTVMVRLRPDVK